MKKVLLTTIFYISFLFTCIGSNIMASSTIFFKGHQQQAPCCLSRDMSINVLGAGGSFLKDDSSSINDCNINCYKQNSQSVEPSEISSSRITIYNFRNNCNSFGDNIHKEILLAIMKNDVQSARFFIEHNKVDLTKAFGKIVLLIADNHYCKNRILAPSSEINILIQINGYADYNRRKEIIKMLFFSGARFSIEIKNISTLYFSQYPLISAIVLPSIYKMEEIEEVLYSIIEKKESLNGVEFLKNLIEFKIIDVNHVMENIEVKSRYENMMKDFYSNVNESVHNQIAQYCICKKHYIRYSLKPKNIFLHNCEQLYVFNTHKLYCPSLINIACFLDSAHIVRLLINMGAEVDIEDKSTFSPWGYIMCNPDFIEATLVRKIDNKITLMDFNKTLKSYQEMSYINRLLWCIGIGRMDSFMGRILNSRNRILESIIEHINDDINGEALICRILRRVKTISVNIGYLYEERRLDLDFSYNKIKLVKYCNKVHDKKYVNDLVARIFNRAHLFYKDYNLFIDINKSNDIGDGVKKTVLEIFFNQRCFYLCEVLLRYNKSVASQPNWDIIAKTPRLFRAYLNRKMRDLFLQGFLDKKNQKQKTQDYSFEKVTNIIFSYYYFLPNSSLPFVNSYIRVS